MSRPAIVGGEDHAGSVRDLWRVPKRNPYIVDPAVGVVVRSGLIASAGSRSGAGLFEPVGAHPAHRGKGLGRA